jgi:hypothetical protein
LVSSDGCEGSLNGLHTAERKIEVLTEHCAQSLNGSALTLTLCGDGLEDKVCVVESGSLCAKRGGGSTGVIPAVTKQSVSVTVDEGAKDKADDTGTKAVAKTTEPTVVHSHQGPCVVHVAPVIGNYDSFAHLFDFLIVNKSVSLYNLVAKIRAIFL